MDDSLRAGVAIYNAGAYRAAHGAWESKWLSLERDTDDERFLHGLIQFIAVAAETLAEELDGYDESVVADAVGYAHEEVADGEQTQFTAMVFDFVRNEAQRGLVFQRLSEHVRRRRRREDDVSGLFD